MILLCSITGSIFLLLSIVGSSAFQSSGQQCFKDVVEYAIISRIPNLLFLRSIYFSISLCQLSIAIRGTNTILMLSTENIFAALQASTQRHWIGQRLLNGHVAFSVYRFSLVLLKRCCLSFFFLDVKSSSHKSKSILFRTMNLRVLDVFQCMLAQHYKCKLTYFLYTFPMPGSSARKPPR